jgi:hypothetical protein
VKEDIAGPLRIVGPRSPFLPTLWPLLDEFCTLHPKGPAYGRPTAHCATWPCAGR